MDRCKKTIVHVDMDAFFAAVEQLDNPHFKGKPVVVGADPKGGKGRGVVAAASYEARRYGIHSAMPISRAYKKCPTAIFVRPRVKRYCEISHQIVEILSNFSPVIEQISIDEAFLDCTGTEKLFGSPFQLGMLIKTTIFNKTGLTASVGIASNKSIAKIASDLQKPNGLTICEFGNEKEFLSPLPISKLWGAGEKTVSYLHTLGIKTIGDLASLPVEILENKLGKHGLHLWLLANGIDERCVESDETIKSLSEEVTFERDTDDIEFLEKTILNLSDQLARRTRQKQKAGKTITVKIRLKNFETHTKSITLPNPVNDMFSIRDAAIALFRNFHWQNNKIRLLGVKISNLCDSHSIQESNSMLFDITDSKEQQKKIKIEELFDSLKNRFGDCISKASLLR
ncbi:MAG: DNA polymerase IV [Spirochaetes bacterium]|nr:DNA polymerase IV [Spirochaetota bacterium]